MERRRPCRPRPPVRGRLLNAPGLAPALRAHIDRAAVADLGVRYATALDTRDWAGLLACFTADAEAVYEGVGACSDARAIVELCRRALDPLDRTLHMVFAATVVVEGDRAVMRSCVHAQHVRDAAPGGPLYTVGAVYRDSVVRDGARWRFTRREEAVSWTAGNLRVFGRGTTARTGQGGQDGQDGRDRHPTFDVRSRQ